MDVQGYLGVHGYLDVLVVGHPRVVHGCVLVYIDTLTVMAVGHPHGCPR